MMDCFHKIFEKNHLILNEEERQAEERQEKEEQNDFNSIVSTVDII